MKLPRNVGLLTCVMLVPFTVSAAPLPEVQVDYSADSTIEMGIGMTIKSRIYQTINKQRVEMGGPNGMTMITRTDKNVIWALMGGMYTESPIDDRNSSGMEAFDDIVEQTEVGRETINGIKTTKSKVVAMMKDGSGQAVGFFWTTKEGILVKMEMYKAGDRKFRMTAELTNLRIEKQDPTLFEIPSGYSKNDMGAKMDMGNMLNMDEIKKSAQQRQSTGKPPPERQDVGKTFGEQLPADVNKIIKGLFGQ
jgi:hypothetical protein